MIKSYIINSWNAKFLDKKTNNFALFLHKELAELAHVSFHIDDKDPFIMHSQYHGYRWPGDAWI